MRQISNSVDLRCTCTYENCGRCYHALGNGITKQQNADDILVDCPLASHLIDSERLNWSEQIQVNYPSRPCNNLPRSHWIYRPSGRLLNHCMRDSPECTANVGQRLSTATNWQLVDNQSACIRMREKRRERGGEREKRVT